MKTKIIGLSVILLIITGTLTAQVKIGIRGGINGSRTKADKEILTPNPTLQDNYRIKIPNYMNVGYHVGLIGQIQLFNFFIQPEALYTVTRNDINIYDLNSSNPENANEITQKLNKIDIPVMLGIKLKAFKAGIGPVMTFLISDDSDLKRITQYDMQFNKATVGYQAGVGLDFRHFCLDLKYEGSLGKYADGIKIGNNEKLSFDSRISQVILSAGIYF